MIYRNSATEHCLLNGVCNIIIWCLCSDKLYLQIETVHKYHSNGLYSTTVILAVDVLSAVLYHYVFIVMLKHLNKHGQNCICSFCLTRFMSICVSAKTTPSYFAGNYLLTLPVTPPLYTPSIYLKVDVTTLDCAHTHAYRTMCMLFNIVYSL